MQLKANYAIKRILTGRDEELDFYWTIIIIHNKYCRTKEGKKIYFKKEFHIPISHIHFHSY